jgi:hypothetical protein
MAPERRPHAEDGVLVGLIGSIALWGLLRHRRRLVFTGAGGQPSGAGNGNGNGSGTGQEAMIRV